MKDQDKTKEQLIDELVELRQRITELETSETERKRVEEALRESEERFRELVENANDIIYTHDLQGNFTSVNPAATRIYGYTIEEILQLNIAQIVDPEHLPLARQKIREKLEGAPRSGPYELLTYSKEGEPIWVEVSTRLLEREGQPIGVLGIARDITERKLAEEALRESKELFEKTFTSQRDAIFILDAKTPPTILDCNPATTEVFGYTRQEMLGRTTALLHVDETALKEFQGILYPVIEERGFLHLPEFKMRREDGTIFPTEHSVVPLKDEQGKRIGWVSVVRDITERKRAEEELQRSHVKLQKALEGTINVLVSAIEMRDPYTAGHQRRVTQLACAIAKEMGLPQEQMEGLRMAGLIHDLGKINVPAEILSKPGPLNDLQYGMIKNHARVGHNVLNGTTEFPWPLDQIVLQHHERLDGSGYPAGLSGEEIMLEARILAVADVVEAMASHRPYRPPRGLDKALEEISQHRGVLYDPEVVDACLKLFTEKGFKFE